MPGNWKIQNSGELPKTEKWRENGQFRQTEKSRATGKSREIWKYRNPRKAENLATGKFRSPEIPEIGKLRSKEAKSFFY